MCLLAIYKIKDSTLVLINIFFSPYTLQRGLWFCNIYLYEWERTQSVCVFTFYKVIRKSPKAFI